MYFDQTCLPVRALNAVKNHASGASAAGSGAVVGISEADGWV